MQYKKEDLARFAEVRESFILVMSLWFASACIVSLLAVESAGGGLTMSIAAILAWVGSVISIVVFFAYRGQKHLRNTLKRIVDYDFTIHDIERP